jgi:hypothetical protein
MKQCPHCQRTYADDSMSFCLSDGALLSASFHHTNTQPIPGYSTNSPETLILPSTDRAYLPTQTEDAAKRAPMRASHAPTLKLEGVGSRSRIKFVLLGAVAVLVIAAGSLAWYQWPSSSAPAGADPAALSKYTNQLRAKQNAWVDNVFIAQGSNGGIKESASAPDNTQQAWATSQCLVGVLSTDRDLVQHIPRLKNAFAYLKATRRTAPVDGWNLYGNESPYTLTEINAWVTLAHVHSLDGKTRLWTDTERQDMLEQIDRDLAEIKLRQSDTGGFRPIRDDQPIFTRTYPTVIALWALADAKKSPTLGPRIGTQYDEVVRKGITWLLSTYKPGQGWVPNPNRIGQTTKFHGLNAQTLLVLSRLEALAEFAFLKTDPTYRTAKMEFLQNKQFGEWNADENNSSVPDPDVRFPGTEFTAEGSTFLWFPWTLAELTQLASDQTLSADDRAAAAQLRLEILNHNASKLDTYVEAANLTYVLGENLTGVAFLLGH